MELENRIAGSTVLVTGGSGFIGAHLCQRLSTCHVRVHAVSRGLHRSDNERLRWWRADFRDISAALHVCKTVQPHFVFHPASYVVGARELDVVLPTFYNRKHGSFINRCRRSRMPAHCFGKLLGRATDFQRHHVSMLPLRGSQMGEQHLRTHVSPLVPDSSCDASHFYDLWSQTERCAEIGAIRGLPSAAR